MDYHTNDLNGDVNGAEIITTLREIYGTDDVNIYGYTGDSRKEIINKFKESGATGILIKPVSANLINEIISIIEGNANRINLQKLAMKNKTHFILCKNTKNK